MGRQSADIPSITITPPISSAGAPIPRAGARSSVVFNTIIPAGTTIPITNSGSEFYLLVVTLPVLIRPSNGVFNQYVQGTGERFLDADAFSGLEIANPNALPVAVSIFIGWQTFVDNRLILSNGQGAGVNSGVVYPTYPTANAAAVINFTDLSGSYFNDINGNRWIAVSRVAIVVCNIDSGTTFLIMKATAATASDPAIAAVYPLTSWNEPISGNYRMATGGGNINVIAHEIYAAIPAT